MAKTADINALKAWGRKVGRAGMSQAVLDVIAGEKSYRNAMEMAGALKAIAIAAQTDDYWSEQVDRGFHRVVSQSRSTAS